MPRAVELTGVRRRYTSLRDEASNAEMEGDSSSVTQEFTVDDLHYLYVVVPRDDDEGTENLTAAEMSDKQFREWIVAKAEMHDVQILPTLGRLGLETRLALVNRLVKRGVRIYLAPRPPADA